MYIQGFTYGIDDYHMTIWKIALILVVLTLALLLPPTVEQELVELDMQ